MLEPRDRSLLFDSLRPPIGYRLDSAVGTTYSLDLMTLLTVPLAFAMFDRTDEEGRPQADPLAILEAMRRSASRLTVFCQSGRIAVPRKQLLLSNLEESVVQVSAPTKDGVFHPKIWLLRFLPVKSGSEERIVYRFICASRNITFDRSWDTMVVLDGELHNYPKNRKVNRPLARFIKQLPDLATASNSVKAVARSKEIAGIIADEVLGVKFELPDGFDDFRFWPLGIDKESQSWPFGEWCQRMAIVSPFTSDRLLKKLADQAGEAALVSRIESLEENKPSVLSDENFAEVFYMDTAADAEDVHEDSEPTEESKQNSEKEEVMASPGHETLHGLHAKIYVADISGKGHVWTGSANATNAAFERNVEFLVELIGKKKHCGVDAFLGSEESSTTFRHLLLPFQLHANVPAPDAVKKRLEKEVDRIRIKLAAADFIAEVTTLEDASFALKLKRKTNQRFEVDQNASVQCWPITLKEDRDGVAIAEGQRDVVFEPVSLEALTSFFAFRIRAEEGAHFFETTFALNVPLAGAPQDRHDRLLLTVLHNKRQVLLYLLLLLADDGTDVGGVLDLISEGEDANPKEKRSAAQTAPLLEPLIRALAKDPSRLDRIQHMVEDLKKTDAGRDRLPEQFDEIWQPIWQMRKELEGADK